MAAAWPAKYKVLGGSHATYIIKGNHERFKKAEAFAPFNYMIVDEAEESFVAFCNAVDKGIEPRKQLIPPIPDLCWFDSGGNLHRNPHFGLPDVAKLDGPAFDIWEGGFFSGGMNVVSKQGNKSLGREAMTASLYTARGCPYGCTFCADARSKVREESLEQITKQVRQLADMGVAAVRLQDDVFSLKAKRCRDICDILHDHGMAARANTRVNLSDPELFRYMASRGITELGFGVESGSKFILDKMQKGTTPEKNTIGVKMAMDAGIAAKSFLMLGFPFESKETIEESKQWVLNTKPTMASCAVFQPFPGSHVFAHPEQYNITIPDNAFDKFWQQGMDDCDEEGLVLELPTISKKDLLIAKKDFRETLEREIGSLDRSRLDSGGTHGMGTFVPRVEEIPGGVAGAM
jgi:radical SAM superfamily enzyme YgiQ (UPF0313 family)